MSRTFNNRSTRRGARKVQGSRAEARHAEFVAELLRNGGNASAAARAVGYHPDHGRRLVSRSATISATLDEVKQRSQDELREWIALAPRAQHVLLELLDSLDERVRFQAAVHILDRALGKVPTKMDATVIYEDALTEVEMAAALSLVAHKGLRLLEAKQYVRDHTNEVMEWAATQVAARADPEAVKDAVVIEEAG